MLALLFCAPAAHCANSVARSDLDAAVHCLGFLESLPADGRIVTAVIYDNPSTFSLAEDTARTLNSMPGPNSTRFEASALSVNDLAHRSGRLDLIFVIPGTAARAQEIRSVAVRNRALSISDDPTCVDRNCCVLMVHSGDRVEVVLNTSLADEVGARFSMVFTMVVTRR